ncbi:DNA-binding MarR family transcriptional regulator [Catenuloplanes nepalensis]|uniref:DNA-binding MarR family transcriptional regulator n=1 Tax=Catenuloplanes nepalensis TaxID=587533 RepID=A0ABT9MUT3_9ACTN|nr:MarR family transcriptional regulator [Catenuloplanes nepalensis]MDP9795124.1 DNA-binding MarR family transcriptional regulator [Catenuloplanes nepalensis]
MTQQRGAREEHAIDGFPDDLTLPLARAARSASRALDRAIGESLRPHRLVVSEFEVLRSLAVAPEGRMRMGALTDSVSVTNGAITHLVDRLTRRDLVIRVGRTGNRRIQQVAITDTGRHRLAEAHTSCHAAIDAVLTTGTLDPTTARRLLTLLAAVPKPNPPA